MKHLLAHIRYWFAKQFPNRKLTPQAQAQFDKFKSQLPVALRHNYRAGKGNRPLAVIVSPGYLDEIDIVYAKSFEVAGFKPLILMIVDSPLNRNMFELCGIECLHTSVFHSFVDWKNSIDTEVVLKGIRTYDDIKNTEFGGGIKVGMNALATFLRTTRSDQFEIGNAIQRGIYEKHLKASFSYGMIATAILDNLKPELMLMNDRVYSPVAEIFQCALNRGIRVMTRNASQATGYEILKSYLSPDAIYTHPHSLSKVSWDGVKRMPWTDHQWQAFDSYIRSAYDSGDWFAEVGTQFNKSMISKTGLIETLELDPDKPVAVVFSHIFWDGTLSYGVDLFDNYCHWFAEIAKVAKENSSVNWIFKVHPANLVKASREGISYESSEIKVIQSMVGELPNHIKILPSDSEISTYSLFSLMDFCLTVRGTIGIEAAAYGVRTLTAGTGRYDRHGFTLDFESKEAFLECVSKLQSVPKMTVDEIELARKFAWAIFKMRHIRIDPLNWVVDRDQNATQHLEFRKDLSVETFPKTEFVRHLQSFSTRNLEDILIYDPSTV